MSDRATSLASYEAVAALSEEEQRRTLEGGDAPERVWAAWALGLRLGPSGGGAFLAGLRSEPPEGTRMHLAALLAGAGEVQAVEALATDDASDQVRATAAQYLIKTSATPNGELARFVSGRLRVECSSVRQRILSEQPLRLGEVDLETLALCGADARREVRELTLAMLKQVSPEDAALAVRPRIVDERDPQLLMEVVRITIAARQATAVLDAAGQADIEQAAQLLRALAEHGKRFEWIDLHDLAARGAAAIDSGVLRVLTNPDQPAAVAWLVSGIARSLRLPHVMRREERQDQEPAHRFCGSAMELLLPRLDAWSLESANDDDLRVVLRSLAARLRSILDTDLEDDDDFDLEAEVESLRRQCNAIRKRLGFTLIE